MENTNIENTATQVEVTNDKDNEKTMENVGVQTYEEVTSSKDFTSLVKEWKSDAFKTTIQEKLNTNEILIRIKEVTELMNYENDSSEKCLKKSKEESEAKNNTNVTDGGFLNSKTEKLDWDKVYAVSTNIIDNYTQEVDVILTQLDELSKKQYLWQESAFIIDAHRGVSIFNESKNWISTKEAYLDLKRSKLGSSAEIIKETIQKLTNKK
ncbi:hypothetical protein TPHA_0B00455 [Tetrapisispora phaffii CBS 4417]|uniref:Uncharacterized protein n=1 Tax=Tetrapisispora phaffii (strain ATCC 24235 / CBS 4417 / NBRC 1672 / NRRL Y-8282 / UCD 70-5) TaxID=1071381 RepID=G8BQC0_TETPH|nr:hypothetical protein TPHA_0B00455 [Tetrapisispora phaffii CBS 4417]CCE61717.1 hypothetical protein TPHA_0B00455 [Tetrapisispora phaffii CBS 4417]